MSKGQGGVGESRVLSFVEEDKENRKLILATKVRTIGEIHVKIFK